MAGTWLLFFLAGVAGTRAGGAIGAWGRLLEDNKALANYGNSVLLGPGPSRPELLTRINFKVLPDPTSSPPNPPPKYSFQSSVSSLPSHLMSHLMGFCPHQKYDKGQEKPHSADAPASRAHSKLTTNNDRSGWIVQSPHKDQSDDSTASADSLNSCVEGGGCALLLSGMLSLSFTLALINPVMMPALVGRCRAGEGSLVLDFLMQHRAELLALGIAQVELVLHRPLDPVLLQTLEEGNPRHVLPLLRQTLRNTAPRSPHFIRQICEAAAQPVPLPSQARVITAQECLLLAAAHQL